MEEPKYCRLRKGQCIKLSKPDIGIDGVPRGSVGKVPGPYLPTIL